MTTSQPPTPNVVSHYIYYLPTTLPKLRYLYITLVLQDTAQKDNSSVAWREVPPRSRISAIPPLLENKRRKKKEAKLVEVPPRSKEMVDQGGSVRGRVYTTSSIVCLV